MFECFQMVWTLFSARLHILRGAMSRTDKAYGSNIHANKALTHEDSLLAEAMQLQGMATLIYWLQHMIHRQLTLDPRGPGFDSQLNKFPFRSGNGGVLAIDFAPEMWPISQSHSRIHIAKQVTVAVTLCTRIQKTPNSTLGSHDQGRIWSSSDSPRRACVWSLAPSRTRFGGNAAG